ncbi:hypothetical protein CRUP_011439 [Coryphaenoides rupestris]|nr:hypothetical protein CRUP_011439 [Coryphaenoides rupestris]
MKRRGKEGWVERRGKEGWVERRGKEGWVERFGVEWEGGGWRGDEISEGGEVLRRAVACMYQLQNGSLIHTQETHCQGGEPAALQSCEGRLCLTVWEASEWSKGLCDPQSQPAQKEPCEDHSKCYEWKTGDWSKRSLCRLIPRHAFRLFCRDEMDVGAVPGQGLCDPQSQPAQKEPCEDHSKCYEWKTGDWSKCSSSCGKGLQSRVVQCMHKVTGRHGNDCPAPLRLPNYRPCHQGACNEKINVNTITSPRLGPGNSRNAALLFFGGRNRKRDENKQKKKKKKKKGKGKSHHYEDAPE